MNQSCAILLFGCSAAVESRRKAFDADGRVASALLQQAEQASARLGIPVFRSTEKEQRGDTFGQRLANAMADVYALGVDRLIVIGGDCSSVRTAHLRAAALKLQTGDNVLGPDRRGGVWLIGLQRVDFDPVLLAALPWETGQLYQALLATLPQLQTLVRLADINSLADLRRLWTAVRHRLAILFDILFCVPTWLQKIVDMPSLFPGHCREMRGPPLRLFVAFS